MSNNENMKKVGKSISRGFTWLEGVVAIGAGIALPFYVWMKRPDEFRSMMESAAAALQEESALEPWAFYGSFILTVALIVYGIGKLRSLDKNREY